MPGRRESGRARFFRFLIELAADGAHGQLDRVHAFFRRQFLHAVLRRQFDIHAEPVGVAARLRDQGRVGVGDGFQMDIAAELVYLAQLARHLHQLLHRVVGRPDDAGTEEQTVDVITQVKVARQLDHFGHGKPRTRHVRAAPVDAVLAIVQAVIGQQDFQQRDAAPVRRVAVANAHARGGAKAILADGIAFGRPAAGAGRVVLGRIGQHFQLVRQFHGSPRYTVFIYSISGMCRDIACKRLCLLKMQEWPGKGKDITYKQ